METLRSRFLKGAALGGSSAYKADKVDKKLKPTCGFVQGAALGGSSAYKADKNLKKANKTSKKDKVQ